MSMDSGNNTGSNQNGGNQLGNSSSLSSVKSFTEFVPKSNQQVNKKNPTNPQRNRRGKKNPSSSLPDAAAPNESKKLDINSTEFVPGAAKEQQNQQRKRKYVKKQANDKEQETKTSVVEANAVEIAPSTNTGNGTSKLVTRPRNYRSRNNKPSAETKEQKTDKQTVSQPVADSTQQQPEKKTKKHNSGNRRRKQGKNDDDSQSTVSTSDLPLREKLERDLRNETYRCSICMNKIRCNHLIWSCHSCYAVFHVSCMKEWIFQNLDAQTSSSLPKLAKTASKFMGYLFSHDVFSLITRCPMCRTEEQVPTILSGCFCGKGMINKTSDDQAEQVDAYMPHSCGKVCGRQRGETCTHPCPSQCHPGPCEACSAVVKVRCCCGRSEQAVRCGTDPADVHCEEVCGKLLNCKEHTCKLVCHAGDCPSCSIPIQCSCYCKAESKIMPCGETKTAICSRNPLYDPSLILNTTAHVAEGNVKSAIYNEGVLGDLDGLSDLSDDEEESETTNQPAEPTKPFKMLSIREAGVGCYSCGKVCGRVLACQRHRCDRICHPGDCGACPYTVTATTTCPCGKHLAIEINPAWSSCADPFPCCGEVCGKKLPCGHTCPIRCHTGPCPTCETPCKQKCVCTYTEREVPCWVITGQPAPLSVGKEEEAALRAPFRCTRVCKTDLNCRRHKCTEICCPHKGQKSDGSFHICQQPCNKILNCGIHHCYLPCHSGPCVACGHIINTPVTCACGKEVLNPPLPCGTPPPVCHRLCSKPCPRGHLSRTHTCHFGPCPPCAIPTDRECVGGHGIVHGVPCYREKVYCGRVCGKLLPCGHYCQRTCHDPPCVPDDCLEKGCGQVCGKKREFCEHTCQALCHPGKPCPAVPCMFDVVVKCPCGHRSEVQKCLIGVSGDAAVVQDLSQRVLECDDECKIIQRNRRFAEALQVGPAKWNLSEEEMMRAFEMELQNCPYSKATLCCANLNPEFVTWITTACDAIARSSHPQPISVPNQYSAYFVAIQDVAKEYGIEVVRKGTMEMVPGEHLTRPMIPLNEALIRFESMVDKTRLHPAQPLPNKATDRDFCTLFIHERKGSCKNDKELINFLIPYLPKNQYSIRSWLRPDGLLLLFNTEETMRRVKADLEMRDPEFKMDYWAVRPVKENVIKEEEEEEKKEKKEEEKKPVTIQEEKLKNENSFSLLNE